MGLFWNERRDRIVRGQDEALAAARTKGRQGVKNGRDAQMAEHAAVARKLFCRLAVIAVPVMGVMMIAVRWLSVHRLRVGCFLAKRHAGRRGGLKRQPHHQEADDQIAQMTKHEINVIFCVVLVNILSR